MLHLLEKIIVRICDELLWGYMGFLTKWHYNSKSAEGQIGPAPHGDFCDLAVVAFNNAKVIEYQIRCLNRFFVFPFRYTVFDNSTDDKIVVQIMEVCKKHDVGYIRLPKQDFLPNGYVSYSHGIACNYIYHRYIKNGGVNILEC